MGRYALLVATDDHVDPVLRRLRSPAQDISRLKALLDDPDLGGFDRVDTAVNYSVQDLRVAIGRLAKGRSKDDLILLYLSCHGWLDQRGRLFFAATDTHTDELDSTALAAHFVNDILSNDEIGAKVAVLDCCFSGAFPDPGFRVSDQVRKDYAVITACDELEYALDGTPRGDGEPGPSAFTEVLLDGLADRRVDRNRDGWISLSEICDYLETQVPLRNGGRQPQMIRRNGGKILLSRVPKTAAIEQFRSHWEPLSRGVQNSGKPGFYFTGRTRVLSQLVGWLEHPDDALPRIVTGDPGSGKSAVLARIVTLADKDYRAAHSPDYLVDAVPTGTLPRIGCVDIAIRASNLSTTDIAVRIAEVFELDAESPVDVVKKLIARRTPTVMVLDAVDEGSDPADLVACLLRPLATHGPEYGIRLLLGARRGTLTGLGPAQVIDLDKPGNQGKSDIANYVTDLLLARADPAVHTPYRGDRASAAAIGTAVARRAAGNFLVAQLLALSLTHGHRIDPADVATLPSSASGAMREFLSRIAAQMADRRLLPAAMSSAVRGGELLHDLLRPLAFAAGGRLPDDGIWAAMANAMGTANRTGPEQRALTEQDARWLRSTPAAALLRGVPLGRGDTAWELFHRELIDALLEGQLLPEQHSRIAEALRSRLGRLRSGAPDWGRADDYTCTHIAWHAAEGDQLDQLVDDPEFLVHAEPDHLGRLLADRDTPPARTYRESLPRLKDQDASTRRQILSLDAHRSGHRDLADRLANPDDAPQAQWQVRWTVDAHSEGNRPVDEDDEDSDRLWSVATIALDLDPVVVSTGTDHKGRVWDLGTGQLIHALEGHTDTVHRVACTYVGRSAVAVTTSGDHTARVWDLTSGAQLHVLEEHRDGLTRVLCTELGGTPVAITTSLDYTGAVWDLESGQLRQLLVGHQDGVDALALGEVAGMPVVVTGSRDETARVWDPSTGETLHQLIGHTEAVNSVTCATFGDRVIAVTAGADDLAVVWDLATGEPIHELAGHTEPLNGVACTTLRGQPVAVTTSDDQSARIWDLSTGRCRHTLTGHLNAVAWIRFMEVADRPAVLTSSGDGTVRCWDLETGSPLETLVFPTESVPFALSPTGELVVAFGSELAVLGRPTIAARPRRWRQHLRRPSR